MGITTCIIVIKVNQENIGVYDITELNDPKISKLKSLNPQFLSISGISNNTIVIFWEGIVHSMSKKNENNLTIIESQIFEAFPRSLLLTVIKSDIVNLRYFSLIENEKVIREKGTLNGKIVEDAGNLLKAERKIVQILNDSIKKKYGKDILEQFRELKKEHVEDDIYKMVLLYFSKIECSPNFDYKSGSLDEYISDMFFEELTSDGILEYSNSSKFAIFPVKKWDNSKKPFGDYIMKALYCLLLQNEIREVQT